MIRGKRGSAVAFLLFVLPLIVLAFGYFLYMKRVSTPVPAPVKQEVKQQPLKQPLAAPAEALSEMTEGLHIYPLAISTAGFNAGEDLKLEGFLGTKAITVQVKLLRTKDAVAFLALKPDAAQTVFLLENEGTNLALKK